MCDDPDNLGSSFVAMFLIQKAKFTSGTVDEILKERRPKSNMNRQMLQYLDLHRQKSGIEEEQ